MISGSALLFKASRIAGLRCCCINGTIRNMSLPAHKVMPMPSLSPTMEVGSIAKWSVKEGDKFEAGQVLAEVETDKATVSLDATDDGFVAKILVGQGEIKVGAPLMITVEEQEHIAAFASYTSPAAAVSTPPAPAPAQAPKTAAPTPAPIQTPAAPVATTPSKQNAAPSSSIPTNVMANLKWSDAKYTGGALGVRLATDQHNYVKKWGFTGFSPAPLPKAPKKKG